jgi:hypothetical protein
MHPLSRQLRNGADVSVTTLNEAATELDRLAALIGHGDMTELENERLKQELLDLQARTAEYDSALRLIACPRRPDGTYNRDRMACEELARKALFMDQ